MGVFFYYLLIFFCPTGYSDVCITGFTAPPTATTVRNGYDQSPVAGAPEALVQAQIRHWLAEQKWQAGYVLWQESRRCRSTFGAGTDPLVCDQNQIPLPAEDLCQGAQDGYEFLVMHRYLLQTIRTLWPQLEDPFGGWSQFPQSEDYPSFLQPRFYAWPNGVLNKVPNIGNSGGTMGSHDAVVFSDEGTDFRRREQLLARWKSEGELGQWLQCGATKPGLGLNSLYGALITNAMPVSDYPPHDSIHLMDLYLFWKSHGWIDRLWEDYRRALGKKPEEPQLQAALIQQCRIHNLWAEKARNLPPQARAPEGSSPLYRDGVLNPGHAGKTARLLGEIVEIQQGPNNKTFIKVDLRLVGVKPLWISSFAPVISEALRLGKPYEFIGTVAVADALDSSGQLRTFLQSPTLLLVNAIQSPK